MPRLDIFMVNVIPEQVEDAENKWYAQFYMVSVVFKILFKNHWGNYKGIQKCSQLFGHVFVYIYSMHVFNFGLTQGNVSKSNYNWYIMLSFSQLHVRKSQLIILKGIH